MKSGFTGVGSLVAIAAVISGCGGSHRLPASLVRFIRQGNNTGVTGRTVEVYGPASRRTVVRASSGSVVANDSAERSGFYLVAYHGHFRGENPSGGTPPKYTILTNVWSAKEGVTEIGLTDRVPATVSNLGRPIAVALKP